MAKKSLKLTKKDLIEMVEFNRLRRKIGEPILNEIQYFNYIYGKKTKIVATKKRYKGIDIPSWADDPRIYISKTSDHIAVKKDEEYKKEVSKKYPVSIAYNKGNYQVLLPSEIQTAGRKM
jgi:hypothetical protein